MTRISARSLIIAAIVTALIAIASSVSSHALQIELPAVDRANLEPKPYLDPPNHPTQPELNVARNLQQNLNEELESEEADIVIAETPIIDVPLEIVLIQDETGSMDDDIGNLKVLAPQIWDSISVMAQAGFRMGVVGFRDYAQGGWGDSGDWVYRLNQDLTTNRADFVAGVNALTANGGNDGPESQYPAVYYAVTPGHTCIDSNGDGDCLDSVDTPTGQQPSFRLGTKRIILLATDASFHDPTYTGGYPGPNRDQVISALQSTNTTVIVLVPGGAGLISQADDLAASTGGTVENTGSSGQVIAEAIASAIGEFRSIPGTLGEVYLRYSDSLTTDDSLVVDALVKNPTESARDYRLLVKLLEAGSVVAEASRELSVGKASEAIVSNIDLGEHKSGLYKLQAELWSDGALIKRLGDYTIGVLPGENAQLLLLEAAKINSAASTEYYQIENIAVPALVTGISQVPAEAVSRVISFLFGQLGNTEEVSKVGEALNVEGVNSSDLTKAAGTIFKFLLKISKIFDLEHTVAERIEGPIGGLISDSLAVERAKIAEEKSTFDSFVVNNPTVEWDREEVASIVSASKEIIESRVEKKVLIGFTPSPLMPLRLTNLQSEWLEFRVLDTLKEIASYVLVAAAVIIIVLAVLLAVLGTIASGGSLGALLAPAGAALAKVVAFKKILALGKTVAVVAMLLLSIVIAIHGIVSVAPDVTKNHGEGIARIESLLNPGTRRAETELETSVDVDGNEVSLSVQYGENGASGRGGPVETFVYALDGSVIEVIKTPAEQLIEGAYTHVLDLPTGSYKSVSVAYGGAATTTSNFAHSTLEFVTASPDLDLDLHLDPAQANSGEAIQATLTARNSSDIDAGEVILLLVNDTELVAETWSFDLGPHETVVRQHSFVPQLDGTGLLEATIVSQSGDMATAVALYRSGPGAAITHDIDGSDSVAFGAAISLPVRSTNGGNAAGTDTLQVRTVNTDTGEALHNGELTVSVAAGETKESSLLALSDGSPGTYSIEVLLNGEPYQTFTTIIEAIDTLYLGVFPAKYRVASGESVELTATVMDSAFSFIDAPVSLKVRQPDNSEVSISLTKYATGKYRGSFTPTVSGTYEVTVSSGAPGYRVVSGNTSFIVERASQLVPSVSGRAVISATRPLSVTVLNQLNLPVVDASVSLANTKEELSGITDINGLVKFFVSPEDSQSYQLEISKPGYARTIGGVEVWVASDVEPPFLQVIMPVATNQPTFEVIGYTEVGASIDFEGTPLSVDDDGMFVTTVAFSEGENRFLVEASDNSNNTVAKEYVVIFDATAPTLIVTEPVDGSNASDQIVKVSGTTESDATVLINGQPSSVKGDGSFDSWLILADGENLVEVLAIDAAGNIASETISIIWQSGEEPNSSITIIKETESATEETFAFDGTFGPFTLNSGSSKAVAGLSSGGYVIVEEIAAGWHLHDVDCGTATATEVTNGVRIELGEAEHVTCTFHNRMQPPTSACPIDPNVGTQITSIVGRGMGNSRRNILNTRVAIPNAHELVGLFGQMAAKEYSGVTFVRFSYPKREFERINSATDTGERGAISWWGTDLDVSKLSTKGVIKGRWFLNKDKRKIGQTRALVLYPTHSTTEEYANVWSTFSAPGNYVSSLPNYSESSINKLEIPEIQAPVDITLQFAITDLIPDTDIVEMTVSAGGVEEKMSLAEGITRKHGMLSIVELTLQDVPAGTAEVTISIQTTRDVNAAAALLGATAHYACDLP